MSAINMKPTTQMTWSLKIYEFFGHSNTFKFFFANHLLLFYWGSLRLQSLMSNLGIKEDDSILFLAQVVEVLLIVNLIFGLITFFLKQQKLFLVVRSFFVFNR